MSQCNAHLPKKIKGRFGALFCCAFFILATPAIANIENHQHDIHQELKNVNKPSASSFRVYELAVTSDIERQVRAKLQNHFTKIGRPIPKHIKLTTSVTLDHSSGEPWVKQIDMKVNLGPAIPTALLSDSRLFLRGWFKSQGYQSATAREGTMTTPHLNLEIVSLGKKPTFGIDLEPYLVVATAILVPVLVFFFFLGIKWQWNHVVASRKGKRLYETYKHQDAPIFESNNDIPNLALIGSGDMQSMFDSMTFTQSLNFLRPLKDEERERVFAQLELKGPVKQLVLDELAKS